VIVTALRPLREGDFDHKKGETFEVEPARAIYLSELGLIQRINRWDIPRDQEWNRLRMLIGAPPEGQIQFATHRRSLRDLVAGERMLILRKYGGLGDILISSMLFPDLHDQHPDISVSYACPSTYHSLFRDSGLSLVRYEEVYKNTTHYHRAGVQSPVLEQYDLIEDISYPCHAWENLFAQFGGIDRDVIANTGGNGLRWRNRLDMWSRWIGLTVKSPRTCITITEAEKDTARRLLRKEGKPILLLAPISNSRTKNYGHYPRLAQQLGLDGWAVRGMHSAFLPQIDVVVPPSIRLMGAMCAVADMIVSVDTSTFHWGGILGVPTVGIFNTNCGKTYSQYYPSASWVQTCSTPCIQVKYDHCLKQPKDSNGNAAGVGLTMSDCFGFKTVEAIVEAVRQKRSCG